MEIFVVMGVSGAGKTTLAKRLACALGCAFQEGDDFHPAPNVAKMAAGVALTDQDRQPWLMKIREWIDGQRALGQSGVISCSVLKKSYRDLILGDLRDIVLVYIAGEPALIGERLIHRKGHFISPALLGSQFEALEPPGPDEMPVIVDAKAKPEDHVARICAEAERRRA